MIPIQSSIEGYQNSFKNVNEFFQQENFTLGGGYTYEHGYFDHPLDWEEEHGYRYYLRIPVFALDGELDQPHTKVELGQPFVIKHEFLTGNDPAARSGVFTALINQFSQPIATEGSPIHEKWLDRAQSLIHEIEQKIMLDDSWQGR
jgi:hypothetical protein